MIDLIPAVLRSGEPYAASCELEAFVETEVGGGGGGWHTCHSSHTHQPPLLWPSPNSLPPLRERRPIHTPPFDQFGDDNYNRRKILTAVEKVKPAPPTPVAMGELIPVEPAPAAVDEAAGPVEPPVTVAGGEGGGEESLADRMRRMQEERQRAREKEDEEKAAAAAQAAAQAAALAAEEAAATAAAAAAARQADEAAQSPAVGSAMQAVQQARTGELVGNPAAALPVATQLGTTNNSSSVAPVSVVIPVGCGPGEWRLGAQCGAYIGARERHARCRRSAQPRVTPPRPRPHPIAKRLMRVLRKRPQQTLTHCVRQRKARPLATPS